MGFKKKKNADSASELTGLELELMKIIWERGSATAAEVSEALGSERPLAATTIHTVLANMRKKGFIEPIPTIERALRFAPRVRQEAVANRSLHQVISDFFGGSTQRLMAHLLSNEKVDECELAELRKLLNSSEPNPKDEVKKP